MTERLLLNLPPPIGWIALDLATLTSAKAAAQDALGSYTVDSIDSVRSPQHAGRRWLTAEEAAGVLGVDASWLLRCAREGSIPHVRLGKYVRFDPDAIVGQRTKPERRAVDTRIR